MAAWPPQRYYCPVVIHYATHGGVCGTRERTGIRSRSTADAGDAQMLTLRRSAPASRSRRQTPACMTSAAVTFEMFGTVDDTS